MEEGKVKKGGVNEPPTTPPPPPPKKQGIEKVQGLEGLLKIIAESVVLQNEILLEIKKILEQQDG